MKYDKKKYATSVIKVVVNGKINKLHGLHLESKFLKRKSTLTMNKALIETIKKWG